MRDPKKPLRGAELLLEHVQAVAVPARRPAPRERLSAKLGEGFAAMLIRALAGDHAMSVSVRREVA
jgi:hypothetical protein